MDSKSKIISREYRFIMGGKMGLGKRKGKFN